MSKVVAIMSTSLDGHVADLNDEEFDWYMNSGDVEIHTGGSDPMTFKVWLCFVIDAANGQRDSRRADSQSVRSRFGSIRAESMASRRGVVVRGGQSLVRSRA